MKQIFALLLVLGMLFAMTACTQTPPATNDPTDPPASGDIGNGPSCEIDPTVNQPTLPPVTVDNPVNYVMIGYTDAAGNTRSLIAYDNGEGAVYVEYVGAEKKVGTFDLSVLHNLTEAIQDAGFHALNGTSVYEDGNDYASMYVLYQDESYLGADYSGQVSQEFWDAYSKLDSFFQTLTAALPVYVPAPVVMGDVNASVLTAMTDILKATGMPNLDSLYISDVPRDEFFDITLGLTDTADIVNGTTCAPMMLTTPYTFVIVTVDEDADADTIRQDFADHLGWNQWVCVSATDAMIAQKDNMILCLLGSSDMFTMTADAIRACGWSNIETYESPSR